MKSSGLRKPNKKSKIEFNPFIIRQVIADRRNSLSKISVAPLNDTTPFEIHRPYVQRLSNEGDTFFRAVGPIIQFVQLFNFFPVQKVLSHDVNALEFRWASFLTARSVIGLIQMVVDFILYIFVLSHHDEFAIDEFNMCATFVTTILAHYLFFRIGMRWNVMMRLWTGVEQIYLYPPFKKPKYSLRMKIRVVSCISVLCTFVEHGLLIGRIFFYGLMRQEVCDFKETVLEFMFAQTKQHFYRHFGYHYLIGFLLLLLNMSGAIIRNFMNLILILMSVGITERLKQLTDRIETMRNKNVPETFWTECRLQYKKLTDLVAMVNDNFGFMILLACFNDGYFLCIQLYYSLQFDLGFLIDRLYYNGTFMLLVLKLLTTLFSAVRIHHLSQKPIPVLKCLSPDAWNSEAERFMFQVQYDSVALSGCNLFVISEGVILAVASTILTYEMMAMDNLEFSTSLSKATICNSVL